MEQLFSERLQAEPRIRLWLETVADIASSAPKEQWHVLASDIKFGARLFASVPGYTVISLLVIALGIGSAVTIFSLINAVLLRSLPYGEPGQLMYLWSPNPNFKGVPDELGPNVPDYYDWQRLSHSFSSMTMLRGAGVNIVTRDSNVRVEAAYVTSDFFQTLRVWPSIGNAFTEKSNRHVAVISRTLWQSHFGSDSNIIGRQIQLNRDQYTVIGVMPKDFGYPFNGDIPYTASEFKQTNLWLPLAYTPGQKLDRVNFQSCDVAIGRLRNGVLPGTAQTELRAIEDRLGLLYPQAWKGFTALVRPLVQTIIGPVEEMLWLLFGAVGLVLMIAIANVSNLSFARATARAHELGIRTALGAERARIIRQLLTESLMMSGAGGLIGVAFAYSAVHVLVKLNPGDIPRLDTAAVDNRVLLVALMLSLVTGVLSGLMPAISASRFNINELLRRGGNRVGGTSNRWRSALIIVEVALSVMLLAGSGLLIRSYIQLAAVDPGFSPSTLTFTINLDGRYNKPELRAMLYKSFAEKLQSIRGIRYVGASSSIPLSHQESVTFAEIRGFGKSREMIESRSVTPNYLKALGTPLLLGRDFDPHDINANVPVVIVNQRFVATYFHGREPLGGQLRLGMGDDLRSHWSTIVGVVGNIRHNKLEEAGQPQVFEPVDTGNNFAVQSSLPVGQVIKQANAALRLLDPALNLESVHTMSERMTESNARRRFQTSLLSGFAAIAIALALAGLYGLISYSVKQRRAEIAVRLAVGSSRGHILVLILSQGLRMTGCGLVIGLAGALALTRFVRQWLFGVSLFDPATFVAVPLMVLVVACCACLIPAWSATRLDPVQVLREG